jgi:hypothetical protein
MASLRIGRWIVGFMKLSHLANEMSLAGVVKVVVRACWWACRLAVTVWFVSARPRLTNPLSAGFTQDGTLHGFLVLNRRGLG